jgi:solute carrier family 10 (sodium/bile acid cotransporter), member 7
MCKLEIATATTSSAAASSETPIEEPRTATNDAVVPSSNDDDDDDEELAIWKNDKKKKDVNEENNNDAPKPSWTRRLMDFYWEQEFIILMVCAILLAKAYPPLGAKYVQPDITATWIAVCFIMVMAGLGLKTKEFKHALLNLKFNVFVQVFSFGVVSSLVFGVSRGLAASNILSQNLADGMVVCSTMPMAINMVVVLTKAGDGDEAAAVFNSAAGNMLGVFLSPVLILGYLGVKGEVDLVGIFYKLALVVVFPVIVGQLLQMIPAVNKFVSRYKTFFKRAQQYCLIFITYTVFCKTFQNGTGTPVGDIFLMILFQFLLITSVMGLAWYSLKFMFPDKPRLRVMGLFGCTQKTVAVGVALINAIYDKNPAVGLYILPLLIWHPMQLILGTLLAPRLCAFVKSEHERLGIVDEDDGSAELETAVEASVEDGTIPTDGLTNAESNP